MIYRIVLIENKRNPNTGSKKEIGIFFYKQDAVNAMHMNVFSVKDGFYECGYIIDYHESLLDYAVEKSQGIYEPLTKQERFFFKWDKDRQGFFEAEEPECMKQLSIIW